MLELLFLHESQARENYGTKLKWIMTADGDYYSGAFLDWFPGNIQHLNSIASVLQCPPAARQQYNETAGRAGTEKQDTFLHSPVYSAGRHWSPVLLPHTTIRLLCCRRYKLNKPSDNKFTTKSWFSAAASTADQEVADCASTFTCGITQTLQWQMLFLNRFYDESK